MPEKISEIGPRQTRAQHFTEHLANERTHLAWLRTSVSVIILGIAINRFSRYLAESDTRFPPRVIGSLIDERRLGFGMVVFGMLLMVWAAIRYTRVSRQIDCGQYRPITLAVWVITLTVLLMGSGSLIWLFLR
jgi:putative membrane protein